MSWSTYRYFSSCGFSSETKSRLLAFCPGRDHIHSCRPEWKAFEVEKNSIAFILHRGIVEDMGAQVPTGKGKPNRSRNACQVQINACCRPICTDAKQISGVSYLQ